MFPLDTTVRELINEVKILNRNINALKDISKDLSGLKDVFKEVLPALRDNTKALRGR